MPGHASATGLLPARRRSLAKPKPKVVPELASSSRPAPFVLKPFAGLFNPYPYGCSVLCNHPADAGAKDVARRVKESLVTADHMETIVHSAGVVASLRDLPIPEEFFRRYTETDSRPISPPQQTSTHQEKPSLIVDLRGEQPDQESETLTWHAIALEDHPAPRKLESIILPCRRYPRAHGQEAFDEPSIPETDAPPPQILRRRGKPLRKKKRRGRPVSSYGLQSEVRQPADPADTQVSQRSPSGEAAEEAASTRSSQSVHRPQENAADTRLHSAGRAIVSNLHNNLTFTFLPAEILRHLCRQLNRERVEIEFSPKRRIALEEALRVMLASGSSPLEPVRPPNNKLHIKEQETPRFFTRRAATFEFLGSESLRGLAPMGYLARHVRVTQSRMRKYRETFNQFCERARVPPTVVVRALSGVLGKPLTGEQTARLQRLVGEIEEPLNFGEWCGLCAAAERLLPKLPPRSLDPASSLEAADFEMLDRRLRASAATPIDPRLTMLLTEIRDT